MNEFTEATNNIEKLKILLLKYRRMLQNMTIEEMRYEQEWKATIEEIENKIKDITGEEEIL